MNSDMMATINGAISSDDIEMSVDGQRLTVSGGTESVDLAIGVENLCSPEKKPDVPGVALNPQAVSAAFKSLSLACSKKDNRESILCPFIFYKDQPITAFSPPLPRSPVG